MKYALILTLLCSCAANYYNYDRMSVCRSYCGPKSVDRMEDYECDLNAPYFYCRCDNGSEQVFKCER